MRTLPNERLGSDSHSDAPERKCILSGEHAARDALVRLAVGPAGEVLPDAHARAPGRGAWIGVTRGELETAIANGKLKGALARAFKGEALAIPDNLGELTEKALTRAFLDRLGLELRAGRMILGSERIAEQARQGKAAWLGHASDASEDGCRKLDQAFRVGMDAEGSGLAGTRLPLDRTALSVALGRDNVVHLALADPASAERVATPLRRLMRFAGTVPAAANVSDGRIAGDAARDAVTTNENTKD
jgi:predicted RNA-binding protein YlxR (DUF448 family)